MPTAVTPATAITASSPSSLPKIRLSLVAHTKMHSVFTAGAANYWLMKDYNRAEAGTPDTIEYLNRSIQFLLSVIQRNLSYASLCRAKQQENETIASKMESTFETLQSVRVDISDMKRHCKGLRKHQMELESAARLSEDVANQAGRLIDTFEHRVHFVLTGSSLLPAMRH